MRKNTASYRIFALLLCFITVLLLGACAGKNTAPDGSDNAASSDNSSNTDTVQNPPTPGHEAHEIEIDWSAHTSSYEETESDTASQTTPSGNSSTPANSEVTSSRPSGTTSSTSGGMASSGGSTGGTGSKTSGTTGGTASSGSGSTTSKGSGTTSSAGNTPSSGTASSTASKSENTSKKVTYVLPDGTRLTLDADQDVTLYTMALAAKKTTRSYAAIEQEILRLCNIERANNGLAPLEWLDDAYYFVKTRTEEDFVAPGHVRPDGRACQTVYSDANVLLHYFGENICRGTFDAEDEMAKVCVDGWMNSPTHRANILKASYKYLTVSVTVSADGNIHVVQHFFG